MHDRTLTLLHQQWLPSKDAASKVGLVSDYISRLCRSGEVEGKKVDGVWYVNMASLRVFLEEVSVKKQKLRERLAEERRAEYVS